MDIKWENPPTGRGRGSVNTEEMEIAAALRAQPQTWGRVLEFDSPVRAGAIATAINTGKRGAFKTGFEAKSRTIEGKGVLYVRFTG